MNVKKLNFKTIVLLMIGIHFAFLSSAQFFQVVPNLNLQANAGFAPQGNFRTTRTVFLITPAEMTGSGMPTSQVLNQLRVNQSVPTNPGASGTVNIYLQNTSNTAYAKGTAWATAISTMTQVATNLPLTLPSVAGYYGMDFNTSNFTYTGGGVYVALEWSNPSGAITAATSHLVNNTIAGIAVRAQSATFTPAATLASTSFRPTAQLGFVPAFDVAVTGVYTLGKLPIEYGAPTIISANVQNPGTNTMTNVNVALSLTGTNSFSDVQVIPSIAPGANVVVNFASYTPASLSTGDIITVTATAAGDVIPSNDVATWSQDVTPNVYTYKNPALPNAGGVGFNGATGDFVAKFNSNIGQNYPYNLNNPEINEIKVDFAAGGQPYQIGIWDATGPGGTPGTLLWQSASATSVAGTAFISVPNVSVSGDYFVGVRQIGISNVSFAYQSEAPIRPQTFYFTSPTGNTVWNDFAPNSPFRFSIEVTVRIPVPPNCAINFSPADGQSLTCNTPILSWGSGGGAPTGYNVYLSTNQADVASLAPAALVASYPAQTATTFNPGTLTPNTVYYWTVIPENPDGPSTGCTVNSFTTGSLALCYCIPTFTGTLCIGSISDVTFNTIANPSSCSPPAYTLFPATGSTTTTVEQNGTYNLSVTTIDPDIISVWIDYDQNGVFDASEWTQVATTSVANVPSTISLTIPGTASLGQTLMRVKSRFSGNPNAATDACTNFGSGECEDYVINIIAQQPCSTPNPGNTISSVSQVCSGGAAFLTMQNAVNGTGITYQWQSADDISFTVNVQNLGTGTSESVSLTTPTYYHCNVTCNNGPVTVASTPVFINILPPTQCYCTPTYTTGTGGGDFCQQVEIPGTTLLNNSGPSTTPFYTLFPQSGSTTCTLDAGSTYTLNLVAGTYTLNDFAAWIDYNANGILDDNTPFVEKLGDIYDIGASATASFVFTVPAGVTPGTYRLRVREADQSGIIDPCSTLTFGETEDYNITINPPNNSTLTATFIIQGYYDVNTGNMQPVYQNSGLGSNPSESDQVTVSLHDAASPYAQVHTFSGVQNINGQITCTFPASTIGNSYYVVLMNRNSVETWSANPVLMSSSTSYNFTSSAAQAFGSNQIDVSGTGLFAIYNGDVTQDGVVDGLDFNDWETDNNNFAGGYVTTDFNGDGTVDGLDFLIWEPNNNNFIGSAKP
jgi:hypothetical protein